MAFWQENYQFIKEVYDMRHMKMAEWMENVEKSIARIMADKVSPERSIIHSYSLLIG